MIKESVMKITIEGAEEYIRQMDEIKDAVSNLRKEVEQLNESLEKTEKLLSCLR